MFVASFCKACPHQKMVKNASSLSQPIFAFVVRLRKVMTTAAKEKMEKKKYKE